MLPFVLSLSKGRLKRYNESPTFVGHFSPTWAKNALQKKESTMLPQAVIAFA